MCDPHPMIQDGMVSLLSQEFEIVGSAADGRSALGVAANVSPAFVILDVALPALNGFEVSRQLRNREPRPKAVFYTACCSPSYVREGFRSGAAAYVSKSAPVADLLRALRAVARGQQYISLPDHEGSLVFHQKGGESQSPFGELTPRQCEVLQLVGEGLSAKAIAAELNVVQKTVEFHKTAIMTVLKLKSSAELVRFAVESGLVGSLSDPNVKNIAELRKQVLVEKNGSNGSSIELAQDTAGTLTTYLVNHKP